MPLAARYVHTNLVAADWRRLVDFYVEVFGCTAVPPERDHHGAWLDRLTGLAGARAVGMHLRLPGCGEGGPTLEIFHYDEMPPREPPAANRPGFAHIAFAVPDVEAARQEVLRHGGGELGPPQTVDVPGAGRITVVYMADPEGNLVELQRWEQGALQDPGDFQTPG